MTSDHDEAARAALRARQGAGARYDSSKAPHKDLLLARRGTAYFARKLNALCDTELDCVPQHSRFAHRHAIASASYLARNLALRIEHLRLGKSRSVKSDLTYQIIDIPLAITLPAHALRHLFHHSSVHLDVEWRDLDDHNWCQSIAIDHDAIMKVSDIPLFRACQLWTLGAALGPSFAASDIPLELRNRGDLEPVVDGNGHHQMETRQFRA